MHKINVPLDHNSYNIFIDKDIERSLQNIIKNIGDYNKVFIITQQSIINIYRSNELFSYGYHIIIADEYELVKTMGETEKIIDQLINNGCTRDSILIGFGGGGVTDLTGFVASIFMRGIDHIFIPTTLLGMVDASIGGKTGVNTSRAKNVFSLGGQFTPS